MAAIAVNGLRLHVDERGSGSPLVLLHGFTGSTTTWGRESLLLDRRRRVIAVDLIGHGQSEAPTDSMRYRMERAVEDLVALLDELGLERTALVGYSLGGRVALHLALAVPERISGLVLESASPGITVPEERAARVRADEALAELIEREGLPAFVERWEDLPLFASQRDLPAEVRRRQREQRLCSNPLGLANSLRGMGAGAMESVVARLGELTMPTLLIVGELDNKYCRLGREMVRAIPRAELAVVANAGHAVHLEQPERFGALVREFLARTLVDEGTWR